MIYPLIISLFSFVTTLFHGTHSSGIIFTDGAGFGSFQQLLSKASSGLLCSSYTNDAVMQFGLNALHNGVEQLNCVNSEQVPHQDICDDGYSVGTESETDTPICRQPHEFIPGHIHTTSSEIDDYVVSISDPIGKEEFMSGRDFDYGAFAIGTDDSELNNIESKSDCAAGNYDTP